MALVPPTAGTLWHTAQLVPLNAGPSPSSDASTSRKSSRPRRNSSNSTGEMPGSGVPNALRVCAASAAAMKPARAMPRMRRVFISIGLLFGDQRPAHERMARAAELRALEHVPSRLRRHEGDGDEALAALRNRDVHVRANDPEAVVRVVAAQADLDGFACFHPEFRRR